MLWSSIERCLWCVSHHRSALLIALLAQSLPRRFQERLPMVLVVVLAAVAVVVVAGDVVVWLRLSWSSSWSRVRLSCWRCWWSSSRLAVAGVVVPVVVIVVVAAVFVMAVLVWVGITLINGVESDPLNPRRPSRWWWGGGVGLACCMVGLLSISGGGAEFGAPHALRIWSSHRQCLRCRWTSLLSVRAHAPVRCPALAPGTVRLGKLDCPPRQCAPG